MQAKPIGDPAVKKAMKRYQEKFGRKFPIDWIDRDYATGKEAVEHIESFISSGKGVDSGDLIDTERIYGKKIDLSEYL